MYEAKIIADTEYSRNEMMKAPRLTTMEITYPRFILPEVNTHKIISKSSQSSRAIPLKKIIERVESDPFVPEKFGLNQPGMQSDNFLTGSDAQYARVAWLNSLDEALASAKAMEKINVHKQHATRILEPYMWQTTILTATEWENFFALRTHKDAQPEIQKLATLMRDAYNESEPVNSCFHTPYVTEEELEETGFAGLVDYKFKATVSAARCARVSYTNHDGTRDLLKDIALAKRLVASAHWSAFEHQAQSNLFVSAASVSNFGSKWLQFRKTFDNESNYQKVLDAQ